MIETRHLKKCPYFYSNKYRSQMTIQSNNNNLNYLIDPRFTKVNRLFVLSFESNAEGDRRDSFHIIMYQTSK